jgi:hypothetical protein
MITVEVGFNYSDDLTRNKNLYQANRNHDLIYAEVKTEEHEVVSGFRDYDMGSQV